MRSTLVLLSVALAACGMPTSQDGGNGDVTMVLDARAETSTDSSPIDVLDTVSPDASGPDAVPTDVTAPDVSPMDAPVADTMSDDGSAMDAVTDVPTPDDVIVTDAPTDADDAAVDAAPDVPVLPCGDGVLDPAAGEECDDGATAPGDGCSASCRLEATYLHETEPNDTRATANLADGYAGAIGAISPLGDRDYFSFNVTVPGSSVRIEVSDGLGGCPAGFDSIVELRSPSGTVLVSDDDDGVNACSLIVPTADAAAANLPVGLYTVAVRQYDDTETEPLYVVSIRVQAPGCGDGLLNAGEQCDDANTLAGDGCSAGCTFERNFAPEAEVNDTRALANPLGTADGFVASISPIGDLDYFSFNVVVPGSSVTIRTSDGIGGCPAGFDSQIDLYGPAGTVLDSNDDGDLSPCSLLSPANSMATINLAVGTYAFRVHRAGDSAVAMQYVAEIRVTPPGCGDAALQPGEQCDDGNNTSSDGCTATCQSESPWEVEPNGSTATATALWPTTSSWNGRIGVIGDRDYYSFTLASTASVTLATHDVGAPTGCGFDTVIHLLDSSGTELALDDDGGPGNCSLISPALYPAVGALPAGTYYVWVQRYNDTMLIPAYSLDLTIM